MPVPDSAVISRRNVWVVLFDKLPLDPVGLLRGTPNVLEGIDQIPALSPVEFTPFDTLDQTSMFFEQYLIQDIRAAASVADTLGGFSLVQQFEQQLMELDCSIKCRRLICTEEGSASHLPLEKMFLFEHSATATCSEKLLTAAGNKFSPVTLDAGMSELEFDSNLVWIEFEMQTEASDQRIGWSNSVVAWLLDRLDQHESSTGTRPVLIVSALRGLHQQIQTPFTTMGDESLVHVPLWIDDGSGHACRLQRLAGSFDMLPTISHYLTGRDHDQQKPLASAGQASVGLADLNCKPTCLSHLSQSFEFPTDRLLKLTADTWTGLRTQQYLLIHSQATPDLQTAESDDDSPGFVPAKTRGLYLKPDDLWNVQNSIVAYEAIANEMESVNFTAEQDHGEPRSK